VARVTLVSRFPEIARGLQVGAPQRVRQSAERVAASMQRAAPVDTGALRDSIRVTGRQAGKTPRARVRAAYYWYFVNYGTRHQAAQPFVEPAIEAEKPHLERSIRGLFD
jgi:HK97 gp10 family phage protein